MSTEVAAADDAPVTQVPLPEGRFLDRELSWLAFNERVLELAEDDTIPLLERSKFLAIFASNLDEFFMVRVAGLKRRIATGIAVRAASGLMPREVLEGIYAKSTDLMQRQATLFHSTIQPALDAEGINVLRWDEVTLAERDQLGRGFDRAHGLAELIGVVGVPVNEARQVVIGERALLSGDGVQRHVRLGDYLLAVAPGDVPMIDGPLGVLATIQTPRAGMILAAK